MEEPLILQAQSAARDKLRTLALLRLSSAAALILPAIFCTLFIWKQTQSGPELGLEETGSMFYDVVWRVWLPIAVISLFSGAIFTWLGYNAWDEMGREYRFDEQGLEKRGLSGNKHLPWSAVVRVETGHDLTIRSRDDAWHVDANWVERERIVELLALLRTKVPKERVVPAPTKLEVVLNKGLKLLPAVFGVLVAAILAVLLYWVVVKGRPEPPPPLLRAAEGVE